ncbi:MAG: phosphate transporter permease [Clostridia bacterium]|jgi:ABC-2 type transport system permease protein|nr:phosphate transporter permease [Clostridia bacterium]
MNKYMLSSIKAEAIKQHKSVYHSSLMYFSMLIWPVLDLFAAYYAYKPFEGSATSELIAKWVGDDKIFAFILFGSISYMFFKCFVQSAWRFSYERVSGTLELIYLTPSNRLGIMLGNALASLFESAWMFTVFCIGALAFFTDLYISSAFMLVIAIFSLVIPSICWGIFMNSLFMFSRDTGIFFTVFQSPMELFGGAKIPYPAFPIWAKLAGGIFPLTWSANIVRKIFMHGAALTDIKIELVLLSLICIGLFLLTLLLLKKSEAYARKTGNMALF